MSRRSSDDEESDRSLIGRLGDPRRVWACYEVGPTGYDPLHQLLTSMGVTVRWWPRLLRIDDNGEPVAPVEAYRSFLSAIERSPYTVPDYAA
jgi:hypothetical protein